MSTDNRLSTCPPPEHLTHVDGPALLAAYDQQLRTDAETHSAVSVTRHGPLHLATFAGGRGFITYRDLGGTDLRQLVRAAVAHYGADAHITAVEWKTRAHDRVVGLHEVLADNGFVPRETESIMLGEARLLAGHVALPEQVTVRRVVDETDVRRMSAMTDEVFGDPVSRDRADDLFRRVAAGEELELWVAEAEGRIIGAGRLEPVPGTSFAGIWGGATVREWRGRGIYRALTAARARSAIRLGRTLIHSDSTEYSRPILERSGLVRASTTTPYIWSRP